MAMSKGGIVTVIVAGIAALVLTTIVVMVIISTVDDSNLLRETASASTGADEETVLNDTVAWTLSAVDGYNRDFALSSIINGSSGDALPTTNYTFTASGTTASVLVTSVNWSSVNISYTYYPRTMYENTTDDMIGNFTGGIDNVSGKLPTILLLAAVVLLFGVIVLLIRYASQAGFGKSGSL